MFPVLFLVVVNLFVGPLANQFAYSRCVNVLINHQIKQIQTPSLFDAVWMMSHQIQPPVDPLTTKKNVWGFKRGGMMGNQFAVRSRNLKLNGVGVCVREMN